MSTNRHVELADKAIEAYAGGPDYEPDDPQTVLTDLLADLMHWAGTLDEVDWERAIYSATNHYAYECSHPEEDSER